MFSALGSFVFRHRWPTLLVAGLFLLLSAGLLVRGGKLTGGTVDGLEATRAEQLLSTVTGRNADTTFLVLFRSDKLTAGSAAFDEAMAAALKPLRSDARVSLVEGPGDVPAPLSASRRSADGHVSYAIVSLDGELKEALAAYPGVRAALHSEQLEISTTGRLPFMQNLNSTLERDLLRAELITLPLALLVLLLVFRTGVAAMLPIGVGALAVVGGIGILFALSHVMEISQYSINVCSLIGLGVAIDYSLFTVARYREELADGHSYPEALSRAVAHAGKVVAFSAMAVGLGLAGLLFFTGSYLTTMGLGGAIVVTLAAVFALTFLPALLAVLGPHINALKLPVPKLTLKVGFWHRLSQWVMKRPVQVLIPTLGVLLLLGSPALGLRLGSADVSVLPESAEARQGFEWLHQAFPDEADTEFTVAVEFPEGSALTQPRVDALVALADRIAALPGIRRVQSVVEDPRLRPMLAAPPPPLAAQVGALTRAFSKGNVVFLRAISAEGPQSDQARAVVRAIRAQRAVGDGTLVVGGESALDLDTTHRLLERAPWAVGFVVLATLIILCLLLGSVLLPIKAVLMNLLSIGGAYGALVWIFQEGHLISAPGRPLEPALPVLLFCVLFGLSMDYEVLILSRMKEGWDRTLDNRLSVAEGLEKTGGLVTSAAAIMVSVFMAFATAHVVLIQAVGVGMAVAVALDATLVRVLLVPATMRLFGDANWWAPRWVHALRRALGIEFTPGGAQPEVEDLGNGRTPTRSS
jgi:RND superfamily putative drug exporter